MLEVREISAFETCALRQKILRPLQTPADCVWPGDDEPGNFHLGVFTAERRLVGVGTFMREGLAKFPDAVKPYRLRGMATDFDQHRRGVGRLLLTTAEERLRRESSKVL